MADRRETLKIIGAVGSTCAFPYSADELYGQHAHQSPNAPAPPSKPLVFTPAEMALVTRLADLIIPATATPGAVAAGVPMYIDYVVSSSARWRKLFRQGFAWLQREKFPELSEERQIALLTPLIEQADKAKPGPWRQGQARTEPKLSTEAAFMKAFKSMTADGFFTSKQGLVESLHYAGNTVLAEFPACLHEH